MTFQTKKYQVIKNAISYELANFIYNYFLLKRDAVKFMYENLPSWLKLGFEENNKLALRLKNGSQVKAVSAAPEAPILIGSKNGIT